METGKESEDWWRGNKTWKREKKNERKNKTKSLSRNEKQKPEKYRRKAVRR